MLCKYHESLLSCPVPQRVLMVIINAFTSDTSPLKCFVWLHFEHRNVILRKTLVVRQVVEQTKQVPSGKAVKKKKKERKKERKKETYGDDPNRASKLKLVDRPTVLLEVCYAYCQGSPPC